MARLVSTSYPGEWAFKSNEGWEEHSKRIDALFKSIPKGRVVRFPIADGYAVYYVVSLKPLVLQHIPYGDAWQIPASHMRGLRKSDVEKLIAREAALEELFRKKG